MSTDVTFTKDPPELVIRLTHPKIQHHNCVRKGMIGWRKDGAIIRCSCVNRLLIKEWPKLFGNGIIPRIKSIRFNEESVIAS